MNATKPLLFFALLIRLRSLAQDPLPPGHAFPVSKVSMIKIGSFKPLTALIMQSQALMPASGNPLFVIDIRGFWQGKANGDRARGWGYH